MPYCFEKFLQRKTPLWVSGALYAFPYGPLPSTFLKLEKFICGWELSTFLRGRKPLRGRHKSLNILILFGFCLLPFHKTRMMNTLSLYGFFHNLVVQTSSQSQTVDENRGGNKIAFLRWHITLPQVFPLRIRTISVSHYCGLKDCPLLILKMDWSSDRFHSNTKQKQNRFRNLIELKFPLKFGHFQRWNHWAKYTLYINIFCKMIKIMVNHHWRVHSKKWTLQISSGTGQTCFGRLMERAKRAKI